jgi:hypothetical protein
MMSPTLLIDSLSATFSEPRLFQARYVNEAEYLRCNRLHARVCGLLARVGLELGFLVDFGRKYAIDPIAAPHGSNQKQRLQKQAEADVSFVDPSRDKATILFDYETSDAPLYKMIGKFEYLSCFAKHCPHVELIGLFITVTGVLKTWRPNTDEKWRRWNMFYGKTREEWLPETEQDRQRFAKEVIVKLVADVFALPHNKQLSLLIGVFYPDHLQLRLFDADTHCREKCVPYSSSPGLNE